MAAAEGTVQLGCDYEDIEKSHEETTDDARSDDVQGSRYVEVEEEDGEEPAGEQDDQEEERGKGKDGEMEDGEKKEGLKEEKQGDNIYLDSIRYMKYAIMLFMAIGQHDHVTVVAHLFSNYNLSKLHVLV